MKSIRALMIIILLCGACSQRSEQPLPSGVETRDDLGRVIRLPQPASRIVSLAPSLTETLFALGLDSAVVGVTSYCTYPSEAQERTRVGGMTNPSIERILSLDPDLVVMTMLGNNRADYEKLQNLEVPVYVSNPTDVAGIVRAIRALAALGGRVSDGELLAARLRQDRERLQERARHYPAFTMLLLVSLRPLIAAAPGTYMDEIVRLANGTNALPPSAVSFPLIGAEEILRTQPDWILTTTDVAGNPDELVDALPQLRSLPAFRNRRIILLDGDLISRPGPRVMQALELIVATLERRHALRTQ